MHTLDSLILFRLNVRIVRLGTVETVVVPVQGKWIFRTIIMTQIR